MWTGNEELGDHSGFNWGNQMAMFANVCNHVFAFETELFFLLTTTRWGTRVYTSAPGPSNPARARELRSKP